MTDIWAQLDATIATKEMLTSCLAPDTALSEADYESAAVELDTDVESIKAVAAVEAVRGPFDADGHPAILFERHYFHRLTQGAYDKTNKDISAPQAGGYGTFSAQYAKLAEAYGLNASAALKSASWGQFQIMGANYQAAGFDTVEQMVAAMMKSTRNQLKAFVSFVGSDAKLAAALREHAWDTFARKYNGPNHLENNYAAKIQAAYEAETLKADAQSRSSALPGR